MADMNLSNAKKEELIANGSFADLKIDWGDADESWVESFLDEFRDSYFADFAKTFSSLNKYPTFKTDILATLRHFIGKPHSCRNWDIYHKYITKPIFDDGWGGLYAILITELGKDETLQELRVEEARWIIAHWEYITAVYQDSTFSDYIDRYKQTDDLTLTKFPEENGLRDKLFRLYDALKEVTGENA